MAEVDPAGRRRLVWLADARLPPEPAVVAFRRALTAAFAPVADVSVVSWLPQGRGQDPPDLPEQVATAGVVVCETPYLAHAVANRGLPRARTWVYVLPGHVPAPGEPFRFGEPLRKVASRVRGLLTDTEASREALEHAFDSHPVDVLVLPPVLPADATVDDATLGGGAAGGSDGDASTERPQDVAEALSRLRRWYALPAGGPDPSGPGTGGPGDGAPDEGAGWVDLPVGTADPGPVAGTPPAESPGPAAADAVRATPCPVAEGAPMVGVFGFDHRFFRVLAQRLKEPGDIDLRLDEWPGPGDLTPASVTLARRADVLVAEWARPNAGWLSARKRPDQYLVVRLHRFEIESRYPADIDIDRVDAVVHVGPAMGREIRRQLGWPAEKLVYVPNLVDVPRYDRPKHPGARFVLGVVGAVPNRKRLDLALDVLRLLRREDPRFRLAVRSQVPWRQPYLRRDPVQTDYWRWCARRVEEDPLLRGAVGFDAPGPDMPRWYRGVGHVLSLSDIESFHAALAEGMASGAVPVLRPWSGWEDLWDATWVRRSPADAAAWVLESADEATWARRSQRARAEVAASFDPDRVVAAWRDLLAGDRDAAATHFAFSRT